MRKPRLTYAGVVSTLALFIALGGVSYAAIHLKKNSVGTAQLKNNSVSEAKIQDGAVTGAKVDLASLGTVPNAAHATSADSAVTATTATSAATATTATSAATATSADSAAAATTAARADTLTPVEGAHLVGADGSSFGAGWSKAASRLPAPVFYKDHEGIVHLEGSMARTSGSGVLAFTLPAGYGPANDTVVAVLATGALGTLVVHSNGEVEFANGVATEVALNSVTWRAG